MGSNLFPVSALTPGQIAEFKTKASVIVQNSARGSASNQALTYRALRASDVMGLTAPVGNAYTPGYLVNGAALAANVYNLNVFPNFKAATGQGFVIFGVQLQLAAPMLDEIALNIGTVAAGLFPLAEIKAPAAGTFPQVGLINEPIWVSGAAAQNVVVSLLSGSGQTISLEKFNLIGWACEMNGSVVQAQSPPPGSKAAAAAA